MSVLAETWLACRTRTTSSDAPQSLVAKLRECSLKVDILLNTRNAASSIGRHLLTLQHGWPGGKSPWNQLWVADLGCTDASMEIAQASGARILPSPEPRAAVLAPPSSGDGVARALQASTADILLVLPAHLARIPLAGIAEMVLGMLEWPEVVFVQAFASQQGTHASDPLRFLLAVLSPHLAGLVAPTSPVLALRCPAARSLPLALSSGYEAALAVDVWKSHGMEGLAQVGIPPLEYHNQHESEEQGQGFRATLAVLEALQRAGQIQLPNVMGHILPILQELPDGKLRERSQLEIFAWKNSGRSPLV